METTKKVSIERVYQLAPYQTVRLAMEVDFEPAPVMDGKVTEAYLKGIAQLDKAYAMILERERNKQ